MTKGESKSLNLLFASSLHLEEMKSVFFSTQGIFVIAYIESLPYNK